jgi:hypothetical protein
MTLRATELLWDADQNRIGRAAVHGGNRVGIVCQRTGESDWEPVYLITDEGGQRELPSCFVLGLEAKNVLNNLAFEREVLDEHSA